MKQMLQSYVETNQQTGVECVLNDTRTVDFLASGTPPCMCSNFGGQRRNSTYGTERQLL